MHNSKSKAFSLIELSIVILIIGILVAGITQSSRLVTQMKLSSARSLTTSSPVSSIKGLALWLEPTLEDSFASNESEDAAAITVWNDTNPQTTQPLYAVAQTGTVADPKANPHTPPATNPVDIAYEDNAINGLPAVNFTSSATTYSPGKRLTLSTTYVSGAANYFLFTNVNNTVPPVTSSKSTTFIVYKKTATTNAPRTLLWNGATKTEGWGYEEITGGFRQFSSTTPSVGTVAMATIPEIATMTINGTGAAPSVYINGSGAGIAGVSTILTPATGFFIGNANALGTPATPFVGYIAEVIVYDGVLKDSDRKSVEAYLGKKYGIKVTT